MKDRAWKARAAAGDDGRPPVNFPSITGGAERKKVPKKACKWAVDSCGASRLRYRKQEPLEKEANRLTDERVKREQTQRAENSGKRRQVPGRALPPVSREMNIFRNPFHRRVALKI